MQIQDEQNQRESFSQKRVTVIKRYRNLPLDHSTKFDRDKRVL